MKRKKSLEKVIKHDNNEDRRWKIRFYSEKVQSNTLGFPAGILANLVHILEMMEELGPKLGLPYTRSMGRGLFEIRAKGREGIGRSLFCTVKDRKVIILHSFIKKSSKTPKREISIARQRMLEVTR